MNTSADRWVELFVDCLIELKKSNVDVQLRKAKRVKLDTDGSLCRGYWDDTNMERPSLFCAINGSILQWGPYFVHEFAHFCQWKERSSIWKADRKFTASDQDSIINNRPISEDRMLAFIDASCDIELDAEKRAVRLFKKYKVPINIDKYIRGANAYVFFHRYASQYRNWYKQTPPDRIPDLHKLVKPTFYRGYKRIPAPLLDAFLKYYPPRMNPKVK